MKKQVVVASFESQNSVYILCDKLAHEIKTWASPQAAQRWFYRYLTDCARFTGETTARLHIAKLKFKIHVISEERVNDDSFESAVVKPPRLLAEKLAPEDHVREPIKGPSETVVGLMCQGSRAVAWRQTGVVARFPSKL